VLELFDVVEGPSELGFVADDLLQLLRLRQDALAAQISETVTEEVVSGAVGVLVVGRTLALGGHCGAFRGAVRIREEDRLDPRRLLNNPLALTIVPYRLW
jgi:hypothetical protein